MRGDLAGAGGYEYGNARVRALKGGLLDQAGYDGLLGRGLDGLLAALAEGSYRADVEAATPRFRGLAALHHALSANLTRTLRAVRGFYGGRAGRALELLLSRWDVENLLAIVRGQARRAEAQDTLSTVVPVGALDAVAAAEAAAQPGLRQAVELLHFLGVPSRSMVGAVARRVGEYERKGDLAALEEAALRAWGEEIAVALAETSPERDVLAGVLREEIDRRNVLVALRLWEGRHRGETVADDVAPFVPGGEIGPDALVVAAGAGSREGALSVMSGTRAARMWGEPLRRWARDGDLPALDRAMGAASTLRAVGLFHRADPLGVGVPAAFVAAKENEVRNLRLIGVGAAMGVPPGALRAQLVVPW